PEEVSINAGEPSARLALGLQDDDRARSLRPIRCSPGSHRVLQLQFGVRTHQTSDHATFRRSVSARRCVPTQVPVCATRIGWPLRAEALVLLAHSFRPQRAYAMT